MSEKGDTGEGSALSDEAEIDAPKGWSRWRWIGLIAATLLIAAAAGIGAFFIAKSSGEDLDAAAARGEAAGQRAGAAEGTKEGYAEGFAAGRKKGYEETYDEAYRKAYTEAYEEAGLTPPEKIRVPES